MEITLELIVFLILAVFMSVCSILAVTTKRILRSATYLLFVLFGTAGIYFQLNYSFLGAVQLLIYAGGITVLYVFSILLTSSQGDKAEKLKNSKMLAGFITTLAGLGICLFITLKIHSAFRGNQHSAVGMYHRRYPYRPEAMRELTMNNERLIMRDNKEEYADIINSLTINY